MAIEPTTFVCASCKQVCFSFVSEEEVMKEFLEVNGGKLGDGYDSVCDYCYEGILKWIKSKTSEELEALREKFIQSNCH